MTLVLDAGAFVAIERADRDTMALLKVALESELVPLTHAGIVGQVWRGGSGRQARIARLFAALNVVAVDEELGRRAGVLLARARRSDVIDAALVLLATDGDWILTSDAGDLRVLAEAAGVHVELVPV